MLQERLKQAKRKLDGSTSGPLHESKRSKVFPSQISSVFPLHSDTTKPHALTQDSQQHQSREHTCDATSPRADGNMCQDELKHIPNVASPLQHDLSHGPCEPKRNINHSLFVEIFAGTAGLTAAVRKVGLHASVGVDSSVSTKCKAPVIRLDLRQEHAQTLLWQILNRPNLIRVHLAPPCGTASRAREIVRKKGPSPRPLRSERYPDGFPWLRGVNRDRVASANLLYDIAGKVVAYCLRMKIVVSVENPARSHFWATSHFSKHLQGLKDHLFQTFFHHCMHGSRRRKHTLLLHNCPQLCKLAILCDGSHTHEQWGYNKTWATSLETAYPPLLCKRYADLLCQHLQAAGYECLPNELGEDTAITGHNNKHSQIGADKQPRGKKIPPLVSEFQRVVTLTGPSNLVPHAPKFASDWKIPTMVRCSDSHLTVVPAHARVLKSHIYGGGDRKLKDTMSSSHDHSSPENIREISVGIQWSPHDFVTRALAKEHPKAVVKTIPTELANAIEKSISVSPSDLSKERTAISRKWFLRACELREREISFKESLPNHCSEVLNSKRLLVFEEMLKASGYKDAKLVKEISRGFDLMGELPRSHVFVHRETFATLTPKQVRESAAMNRQAIVASVAKPMDEKICKGVYEATLKELEAGWLTGPIPLSHLDDLAVCTRRFGVIQHSTDSNGDRIEKVRPIDDFTESLVNLTNGTKESIVIHGVDFIIAGLAYRLRLCRNKGVTHDLQAKTVDLRKAYKQLPISVESLNDSFLCVKEPDSGKPRIYNCKTLPFGARAAVTGFCRTSHAIWFVGVALMFLHWSVYFDDFMVVEDLSLSKHTNFIVDGLFSLLGWETSSEKGGAFDSIARALGVVFDLADTKLLTVKVLNSSHRCKEIGEHIDKILKCGRSSRSELEVVRGRLIFVESFIYGRNAHAALRVVSKHIHGSPFVRVDDELRRSLIFLRDRVLTSSPRIVNCCHKGVRHIYTDACFEPGLAGLGGLAYDGDGIVLGYFSYAMPSDLVELIKKQGQETIIAELEALALLAGVKVWLHGLSDLQVVLFCDNDSVLASLIKLGSKNDFVSAIASILAELEAESRISLWFERVPSASNPADPPSRLDFSGLKGVSEHAVDFASLVQEVLNRRDNPII